MKVNFCFEKVTNESAEYGGFSDHGFYHPGGWYYSMNDDETRKDILENPNDYSYESDLQDIIHQAQMLGITESKGARWFYSVSNDMNAEGEYVNYSLHFKDNITESSKKRILHLIKTY